MNKTWSSLLVIRPDAEGAMLEDSSTARSERVPAIDIVRQLLSDSDTLAGGELASTHDLDPTLTDWVANGWRPSLEYFNWSEVPPAPSSEARAEVSSTAPAPATSGGGDVPGGRWSWEDSGSAPAEESEGSTVGQILIRRRTTRHFKVRALSAAELSRLLRNFTTLANQPTEPAGAWSGLRMRAVVYSVEGLNPGVWDLDLEGEAATQVSSGDGELREVLANLMCGMQAPITASATIVLVVNFPERQKLFPYERGLRELYVEVGRIAQKFILAAEAQGIGTLITPATNDHILSDVLGLVDSEAPVYTITFGPKATAVGAGAR
jgi:hypothetical protein